jgi:putative thioredoxin
VAGNFEAEGLAARIRLGRDAGAPLTDALEALDSGDREKGIELLLGALDGSEDGQREEIRRAIVGALNELGTDDPRARDYRRRLAAAIY